LLPSTSGLTRLAPTIGFFAALAGSMYLLAKATDTISIGTGYAMWVGIGAVGAGVVGIVVRGEPATAARLFFLGLLVVSIIGLKAVTPH
jgi:quaternary ammonium compound-resistance protein SugE